MIPADILTFLQGQGNLQTSGLHQNTENTSQVHQGIKDGIFDALMAEYTAENPAGVNPEAAPVNFTGTQQLMTFTNGRTAMPFQTVNIISGPELEPDSNSESVSQGVKIPENPDASKELKHEKPTNWMNIFSDTRRTEKAFNFNPRPVKQEFLSELPASQENDNAVIWQVNTDSDSDSEQKVNTEFKTQTPSYDSKIDSPVESLQPLPESPEITDSESEALPEVQPVKTENVSAAKRPAETSQPRNLVIRAADEIPDDLKPNTDETAQPKPELPQNEQGEQPETEKPEITEAPETVKVSEPLEPSISEQPETESGITPKTERPEIQDTDTEAAPQADGKPADKKPAKITPHDVPKNETPENESAPMNFDSPESTELLRGTMPLTSEYDSDSAEVPGGESQKILTVNEPLNTPKIEDNNEITLNIPEKPEEPQKPTKTLNNSPEITDVNLSMAGFTGLHQNQNEPLIRDSAPENPDTLDAPRPSRVTHHSPQKPQADSQELAPETPETPETSSTLQNRSEKPEQHSQEFTQPQDSFKADSEPDNPESSRSFPKSSSPAQRASKNNERSAALGTNTRRTEAHNDFQSFFDGITRTRRTSSRVNTQPLSLRTGTYDSAGIDTRSSTMRNGIVNVVRFIRADGVHKASIVIDPPALGRISIEITSGTSGIEASVKVAGEQIRQIVQDQITQLRDNLSQQGVQVSEFTVDVQQDSGRQNQNQNSNGQNQNQNYYASAEQNDDNDTENFRVDLEEGLLYWVA